jgi:hypothetical protein
LFEAFKNISKEIISHVMKFKPLSEMGFENSQKSSTVTAYKNLFTAGGNVLNERETT